MSRNTKFKSYGEWLFEEDRSSIIYERKNLDIDLIFLNEGWTETLMDLGQIGLSVVGAIPPLEATGLSEAADIANFVIYLGRQMWLSALFSAISIIPIIGDAIGKSGQFLSWIARVGAGEGAMATVVSWISRNISSIYPALQRLSTFMDSWGKYIKRMFEIILEHIESEEGEGSSSSSDSNETNRRDLESAGWASVADSAASAALMEQASTTDGLNSIPAYIRPIADTILASDTLKNYFKNPNVVRGLTSAVDQAQNVITNAMNLVSNAHNAAQTGGVDAKTAGSAASSSTAAPGANPKLTTTRSGLTESVYYTDTRFKKLAGIK